MRLDYSLIDDNIELKSLTLDSMSSSYLHWLHDSQVTQYLEVRHNPPTTFEVLSDYVIDILESSSTMLLGIHLRSNGLHIGNIKLGPICISGSSADIGFFIGDRVHWGKGYMSAAINLLAKYAFNELGLVKLTAGCYIENVPSRRTLEKCGFYLVEEITNKNNTILNFEYLNHTLKIE